MIATAPARRYRRPRRLNSEERRAEKRRRYRGYEPGADDEWLMALLSNEQTFELGERVPVPDYERVGGRRREHQGWMYIVYACSMFLFGSAAKAGRELKAPYRALWLGQFLKERYPNDETKRWPDRPMTRRMFCYARDRYLTTDETDAELRSLFELTTPDKVREVGLALKGNGGSHLNPVPERLFTIDGTTVPARSRHAKGAVKRDRKTGKKQYDRRYDPDAEFYVSGDPERSATGIKHVFASIHGTEHGFHQMIVGVETMDDHDEAGAADRMIDRLYPQYPGVLGSIADAGYRGKSRRRHYQHGKQLICPQVAAKRAPSGTEEATPKFAYIDTIELTLKTTGEKQRLGVYSEGGQVGVGTLSVEGELLVTPVQLIDVDEQQNKDGSWRWYAKYRLPDDGRYSGETFNLRIDGEGRPARSNPAETVHIIANGHPIYDLIRGRRQTAESVNSQLKMKLAYHRRSHTYTRRRQRFDMLAFALLFNSMAIWQHRQWLSRQGELAGQLAA